MYMFMCMCQEKVGETKNKASITFLPKKLRAFLCPFFSLENFFKTSRDNVNTTFFFLPTVETKSLSSRPGGETGKFHFLIRRVSTPLNLQFALCCELPARQLSALTAIFWVKQFWNADRHCSGCICYKSKFLVLSALFPALCWNFCLEKNY